MSFPKTQPFRRMLLGFFAVVLVEPSMLCKVTTWRVLVGDMLSETFVRKGATP